MPSGVAMSQWIAVQSPQGARVVQAGYVGPAGTTLPDYTLSNVGQVLGVINSGGVAVLAWVDQTGGGSSPSMDFTKASNSMYVGAIL